MFTRCPQCKTVHPLTAGSVSYAHGRVQCGHCDREFSALNFLFDVWPSGQAYGPATDPDPQPPILGPGQTRIAPISDYYGSKEPEETWHKPKQTGWGLATALLILLTVANAAWTFRDPLIDNPGVRTWMKQMGWSQAEQDGLLKEPLSIKLVSHDIHAHPTRSGILILSLTFVNLAPGHQEFPQLELTLLDAASQPVARRRLQPVDYLRPGFDISAGLASDVYLPVLLELGDPGEQAVGFEVRFL